MTVTYSQIAIDARLNGVVTVIGFSGIMQLREGSTVLAQVTLASPCGSVSGGVLTFTTPLRDANTAATGNADNAIVSDALGGVVISGLTVGIPLSAADVVMSNGFNSRLISSGQVVTLIAAQITGS